jgi:hypothetical protein
MYAVASVADEPLLCAGDDLARAELLLAGLDTDEVPADLRQADEPGPFCE